MERIVDETVDVTEKIHVPIEKKMNLTIKEAAEYSNIGINKIAEMLRNPMCNFVLYKSEDEFFLFKRDIKKNILKQLEKKNVV